jgi:flavin reductase (DIM6/NTAB) family NADH-FMN oxidoreductase RutF
VEWIDQDDSQLFDGRQFRTALGRFGTGVTVITTLIGTRTHGMTANAFTSVSLNPPLVLVAVDNRAHMVKYMMMGRFFGVSVLAEDQRELSDHFAGRGDQEMKINFVQKRGMPLIEGALAYLILHVVQLVPAGDHTLVVGQVDHLECAPDGERPLMFYGGQYRRLARQDNAPPERLGDEFSLFSMSNF